MKEYRKNEQLMCKKSTKTNSVKKLKNTLEKLKKANFAIVAENIVLKNEVKKLKRG